MTDDGVIQSIHVVDLSEWIHVVDLSEWIEFQESETHGDGVDEWVSPFRSLPSPVLVKLEWI